MNRKRKMLFIAIVLLIAVIINSCSREWRSDAELTIVAASLKVIPDKNYNRFSQRVSTIIAKEIKERTGADIITDDTAAEYSIVLKIDSLSLSKNDGFSILTTHNSKGKISITGQSKSGLLAGIGKLLRISSYSPGTITIPDTTIEDAPMMNIRGLYPATHFHNYYHVAPNEKIDKLLEDFALLGANNIYIAFDMHEYDGLQHPKAQKQLSRVKHIAKTTHDLGMKFTLGFIANEGYNNTPKKLRAKRSEGIADYGTEICPSTEEGRVLILKNQKEIISSFDKVEMFCSWPYDQGGCACDKCSPWGGNGFIKISKDDAENFHKIFPKGEFWLSTWNFDLRHTGDYAGLFSYMQKEKPDWITGLLTGIQSKNYLQTFDRPYPEKYKVAWFPEISMLKVRPWMWSANPLPNHFKKIIGELKEKIVGGWIYSEGIYEDINKFIWFSYYWNPDKTMDEIMHEYAAYYLSPDIADEAVKLFHLLEESYPRKDWNVENLDGADEAYSIAEQIDKLLPQWSKKSWRWRSIYDRVQIDYILKKYGHETEEAKAKLRPIFDEIERINYIQPDTYKWLQLVDKMLEKLKKEKNTNE